LRLSPVVRCPERVGRKAEEAGLVKAIRTVIAGAGGRMGHLLVRAVLDDSRFVLAGALEAAGHASLGTDAGILVGSEAAGIDLTHDAPAVLNSADAVIDFTTPAVSVALAAAAASGRVVHVIGTTGFSADDEARIHDAARHTVIVKSGNMSLGIALLAALVKRAAKALPDFDIEILEMHHRMKVDAPSGTALILGRAAADVRSGGLREKKIGTATDSPTGRRKDGAIGFASVRGGTVVGEHHVILAGPQERVVLTHIAEDRTIFVRGALAAAEWGQTHPAGLYEMADVLGIAE